MQHKSLFAALLCGALCLTACLKNEESPSVTQVRNAKAAELQSIAAKNDAEATATVTLANAEAKIKEAQAAYLKVDAEYRAAEIDLVKAQAALVLAEAELKQVEAELKRVDVDIKKVELQQKSEELKAQIKEYEARIAAAEAAKMFFEGQKDLIAKSLEAALLEAEAAVWDAKKELFDSQKKYEDAVKAAEEAATEANREAIEALRERITTLSTDYHAACHELINLTAQIAANQALIAAVEAGIADLQDVKNAQIEANNKEIARAQKILDAMESIQGMTTEEILDASIDVLAELIVQSDVTAKAAAASEEAYNAYIDAIPYTTLDEEFYYEDNAEVFVTYSFTHDFFVRNPDQKSFTDLEDELDEDYYHKVTDDLYVDSYVESYVDPEDGLSKTVITEYEYDHTVGTFEFLGETYEYDVFEFNGNINEYPLWTWYEGPWAWGEKMNGYERYPEIGEGLHADTRAPYAYYEKYEYLPLEINREGYEYYVNYLNETARLQMEETIADIDYEIAWNNYYIDEYQEFMERFASTIEAMDEKLNEAQDALDAMLVDLVDKYNAYYDALDDYYASYIENNIIERTDAWWAYWAAVKDFDEAKDAYEDALAAENVATLKKLIHTYEVMIAKAQEYIADGEGYAEAKVNAAYWANEMAKAQKDVDDAAQALATAEEVLGNQQKVVEDAKAAEHTAYMSYLAAEEAWYAAGAESPSALEDAMNLAWQVYVEKSDIWSTEYPKVAPLETAVADAEGVLQSAQNSLDSIQGYYDDAMAVVNEPVEMIDELQGKIDDINARIEAYDEAVDAAKADLDAAKAVLDAALAAWDEAAGTEDFKAIADLYNAFSQAYADYEDPWKNPVLQVMFKYGMITDPTDIEFCDDSEYGDYIEEYGSYEYYDIWDYWYYYLDFLYEQFGWQYRYWGEYSDTISPMGIYVTAILYQEEIEDLQEENEAYEALKPIAQAEYEAAVEENNKLLTELDEVLANEEVYKEGIAELNNLYAAYVSADKAYFDEYWKSAELEAQLEALQAAYEDAEEFEEAKAAVEERIALLEADNEDWSEIETIEFALELLKAHEEVFESEVAVQALLVASLESELAEAVAELAATIEIAE